MPIVVQEYGDCMNGSIVGLGGGGGGGGRIV